MRRPQQERDRGGQGQPLTSHGPLGNREVMSPGHVSPETAPLAAGRAKYGSPPATEGRCRPAMECRDTPEMQVHIQQNVSPHQKLRAVHAPLLSSDGCAFWALLPPGPLKTVPEPAPREWSPLWGQQPWCLCGAHSGQASPGLGQGGSWRAMWTTGSGFS